MRAEVTGGHGAEVWMLPMRPKWESVSPWPTSPDSNLKVRAATVGPGQILKPWGGEGRNRGQWQGPGALPGNEGLETGNMSFLSPTQGKPLDQSLLLGCGHIPSPVQHPCTQFLGLGKQIVVNMGPTNQWDRQLGSLGNQWPNAQQDPSEQLGASGRFKWRKVGE